MRFVRTRHAIGLMAIVPLLAAASALGGPPADQKPIDLSVSRVALFSSGVGYFEATADVEGDATAELKFRTDQINDILKSLVVQDFDGGSIGAVSYASRDPIEKSLRSFGVDITGTPTLEDLLRQLRGEPVEVTGPRTVQGVILGVEEREVPGKDAAIKVKVVNLLSDNGLQQIRIDEIVSIKLLSEKVEEELRKALATLATAHDADKKSVTITFNGTARRRVRAAYILEAPIWKTSYRLVLSSDKKPFLQGWATVENATEEDWKNVRLSLISGRPISFRMDLYTPLYVPRPLEQLELYASLRPPEFEGGFGGLAEMAKSAAEKKDQPARGAAAGGRLRRSEAPAAPPAAADALLNIAPAEEQRDIDLGESGVSSVATAQEAGELFEYSIAAPVSIPRQHSAMLPIVNEPIDGEKVSIYNPATHAKYPLNGLELKNTTKLNLMQGPVTLFDGNVYAGDAKLPDVKPDEKRLIAYALDLSVEVLPKTNPIPDELVSLRIAKGVLYHRHKYVDDRTYEIKNKADKDRTVILEQAYSDVWKLVEPKEPYERTKVLLRFKASAPAGKTVTQHVQLERYGDVQVVLTNAALDEIIFWTRTKQVSPKVKEALEQVIKLRTELDDAARRRAALEQQVNEAVQEQARVRENLKTLDKGSDPHARQLRKFDDLETQIEKLRGDIAKARAEEEARRKALEQYLLNLDVE